MGMIPGTFVVKDGIDITDQKAFEEELKTVQTQPAGSCGGSCDDYLYE